MIILKVIRPVYNIVDKGLKPNKSHMNSLNSYYLLKMLNEMVDALN